MSVKEGEDQESSEYRTIWTNLPMKLIHFIRGSVGQSWGRYPKAHHIVQPVFWRTDDIKLNKCSRPVLPFGQGRSYGDSCLNNGGILLDTSRLSHFIAFDKGTGILRCEAGVILAEILKLIIPYGWFLPVTPGTKFVSIGGAIANDVHGKNHHCAGTFGSHVLKVELLRSNGERIICSRTENQKWFKASIGGLGLTGLILWAEVQLKPIKSQFIDIETIKFADLDEFFELSAQSDKDYEYTVAWFDSLSKGASLGRGLFMRGNHSNLLLHKFPRLPQNRQIDMPIDAPNFVLNTFSIKILNLIYYHKQRQTSLTQLVHYNPFFYPLDAIGNWNRIYGKRGFMQYQCVVPCEGNYQIIKSIIKKVAETRMGSFLSVIKKFGDIPSPGMLSFPKKGVTLALDFPNQGESTLRLLEQLDTIVRYYQGSVYPAKDARMSPESFQTYYPQWQDFAEYIDPKFSSSFWRRVTTRKVKDNRVCR